MATFVAGRINASYFGYARASDLPSTILTTDCTADAGDCPFSSLSQYFSNATSDSSVYKLFSSQPLSAEVLGRLFVWVKGTVEVHDWQAYPVFHEREVLPAWTLELEGGGVVWYANAFEGAVSCMECAAVSAKNVALLVKEALDEKRHERERREEERRSSAKKQQQPRAQAGGAPLADIFQSVHLDL